MNNLLNIVDNSLDLIIVDKTYDNYDILLETVYNKLKDKGTCWLLTDSHKLQEQISSIKNSKFINHLENWCTITTENNTFNFYHLTKSDKYTFNNIEIKRDLHPNKWKLLDSFIKFLYPLYKKQGEKGV